MTTLTGDELRALVNGIGITCTMMTCDATYNTPTKEWLLNTFYKAVSRMFKFVGLPTWREDWDCDDFARLYATHAQILHARDTKSTAQGLAVGEFWYKPDSGGGHAINIAVIGPSTIIFIEPQTGAELKLSSSEIKSAFFVRF